jgi:hypothetical protein
MQMLTSQVLNPKPIIEPQSLNYYNAGMEASEEYAHYLGSTLDLPQLVRPASFSQLGKK